MQIDLFGNVIKDNTEEELKVHKPSPFDFIKSISNKNFKEDLHGYVKYVINLGFSMRSDTIHYANEMNKYDNVSDEEQYAFYFHAMPKKNYFAKWQKMNKTDGIDEVAEYYSISKKQAVDYCKTLKLEQIQYIKSLNLKGGKR